MFAEERHARVEVDRDAAVRGCVDHALRGRVRVEFDVSVSTNCENMRRVFHAPKMIQVSNNSKIRQIVISYAAVPPALTAPHRPLRDWRGEDVSARAHESAALKDPLDPVRRGAAASTRPFWHSVRLTVRPIPPDECVRERLSDRLKVRLRCS